MDYRERRYFLIRLEIYNKEVEELKELVPSIKFHAPYNHFKPNVAKLAVRLLKGINIDQSIIDISDCDVIDKYIQQMASCKIEDSEKLLSYFKSKENQYRYITELTKDRSRQ